MTPTRVHQLPSEFWREFAELAERRLLQAGVRSRGIADGDLAIGQLSSIRNEAFVVAPPHKDFVYPPNETGWNAAGQLCPLDLKVHGKHFANFKLKVNGDQDCGAHGEIYSCCWPHNLGADCASGWTRRCAVVGAILGMVSGGAVYFGYFGCVGSLLRTLSY